MALEHQFQWFLYNGKLYVSPQSGQVAQRMEVSSDAAPDLKQALTDIGLLDKRFGWGELPDEGVVLVSGPARYVELIRGFSKEKVKPQEKQQVMMFSLRYAAVADRDIHYREQSITIPGVATLLDGLLQSKQAAAPSPQDPAANIQALQGIAEMGRNKIINLATDRSASREPTKAVKTASNRKVVADVRNNAVLIYDTPEKRDMYQQLIEQLDQPSNLVEIDAIILDIDRTQVSALESRWSARAGSVSVGSSLLTGGSATLSITDFDRFFADIQALEGQGVASVIARPSVLTLENQPAVIDFSRTAYITATGERVANVQSVTAGTSLQVIPRTIGGAQPNRFQLIIDIEDGQLDRSRNGETPDVKRGTVSTQAVIGENRSLVIGGFHVDETGQHHDKVPLLGDLPILGPLFTAKRQEVSRRERLFILTPRLIGDQIDPARYIANENRPQLDKALALGGSPSSRERKKIAISNAFSDLVKGSIPADLKEASSGVRLEELCKAPSEFLIDPARGQWFVGDDFDIVVGVVRNTSGKAQDFSLASCPGDRTLAVTMSPGARLQPGQSTEVFVAIRPVASIATPDSPARVSMLSP
ncbi:MULTISPECIES: type III secretion system outer membrane ring subunit SctC [Pseudomonas]|nr:MULTISPECIES: type III secretion system outer membrane ring subunit SctC [Pseudomonas]